MKKILLLLVLVLLPGLVVSAADEQKDLKPLVTIKVKDGGMTECKFDSITNRQVICFRQSDLKAIYFDRHKVVSINFNRNQEPKLGAGVEGVVLSDGTVVKGHIVGIDQKTGDFLVNTGGGKQEVIDHMKVGVVELSTSPEGTETPSPTGEKQVVVPATSPWTDTGIDVNAGDQIWVVAPESGFITCGAMAPNTNPDGVNPLVRDPNRPLPDVKACALLGRIGTSIFRIGLNRAPVVAQQAGRFYLGVNDYQFTDNAGQWVVTVKK